MGKRLYVGNLPYDADEAAIRDAFSQDGRNVVRVHIPLDRETNRPRGFAFVEMASDQDTQAALAAMNGFMMGTRTLRVSEAEDRRPGPGGGPGGPREGGPRPASGYGSRPGGPGGPGGPRPDRPPRREDGPRSFEGGGAGGVGAGGAGADRTHRFGPDARPRRERERERERDAKRGPRRRDDEDGDYGGRRGGRRYDDDDE